MQFNRGRQALYGVTFMAALMLGGCDNSREASEQPAAEGYGERNNLPDGGINAYAEQAQEPDRDMSILDKSSEAQPMAQFAMVDKAVAEIKPTAGNTLSGVVTFAPNEDETQMNIHVVLSGLDPGKHGFHIHQTGDCSAEDASSAGEHFNPYKAPHGGPEGTDHHLGDLGNIVADANGQVDTTLSARELAFSGPASVLQKAVIVHAGEDDLQTDPSGNSGDRVGCGVIRQEPEVLADAPQGESSDR
jgi:Cu-Zn family superoxide dismutase